MKGPFRLRLLSLLLLLLWSDYAAAFTTKQKSHKRKRHHHAPPAAFDWSRGAVAGVSKEAEVTTGIPGIQQQQASPPVPFGIAVNPGAAAATAVSYQHYHEQEDEDDEEPAARRRRCCTATPNGRATSLLLLYICRRQAHQGTWFRSLATTPFLQLLSLFWHSSRENSFSE